MAGSLSPLEVERYVTYPVEATMNGLPSVEEMRSVSKFGLSVVTIVFQEGTDIYRARQLVNERLADARERIIAGYGTPSLGVLTTALGEMLQFEVRSKDYTPMELRTMLEWEIAPQLRQVPGVTEINCTAASTRAFEVTIDPDRLAAHGVALGELFAALERNNAAPAAATSFNNGEQRFIRGQALLKTSTTSKTSSSASGTTACRCCVGTWPRSRSPRHAARRGHARRPRRIVTGMVMMLLGENSRTVVEAAKERLPRSKTRCPAGVKLEVIYDRAEPDRPHAAHRAAEPDSKAGRW